MTKQKKSVGQSAKPGRYVIGSAAFAKISAVESIHLTDAMKQRAAVKARQEADGRRISPDNNPQSPQGLSAVHV